MNENDEADDYLWDHSAPPDPEVRRLEELLGRYRLGERAASTRPRARSTRFAAGLAAAIAATLLVAWIVRRDPQATGYRVEGVEGRDLVRAGESISTGDAQRARIEIGALGHVDVEPNSRLEVGACSQGEHRLFLARGSVSARISAKPRIFRIDSPAGDTIDLGCAYRLDVAPDGGVSTLRVTLGQVAFEFEGREIYVPAGAACESVRGRGPAAPVFERASAEFRSLLRDVEFASPVDPQAVRRLIDLAEREDSLTLWHLFTSKRTDPALRRAVYDKLSSVFPKPSGAGITETGLLSGDHAMCEAWMEEMKPAWR